MFRFSIRDVLWLTVVVGLAVLWWGEYRQRTKDSAWRRRAEVMREFLESIGEVVRWKEGGDGVGIYPPYSDNIPPDRSP